MTDAVKEKRVRKSGKRRYVSSLFPACPHIIDMRTPHLTESSGVLATKLLEYQAAYKEWRRAVREHFVAGGADKDAPVFSMSKFFNPNTGAQTRKQYEEQIDAYNTAIVEGKPSREVFGPRYNPVLVEVAQYLGATSIRRGGLKKHGKQPKNWDEAKFGPWSHDDVDEEGNPIQVPSCWFIDETPPRRAHAESALDLVDDPENDVMTIGNNRYIVGDGSFEKSAPFRVWAQQRGNYRACDEARKHLSLAGMNEIVDLVFRIEDRPNNGGGYTVKGQWPNVREVVFMPGQVLTPGYLYLDEKVLSVKDIRAMTEFKGIRFKACEPIVGKAIPWSEMWPDIQSRNRKAIVRMRERAHEESDTPQGKSITNARVTCRLDPSEAYPFGFRAVQAGMVPYMIASGKGKVEDGYFSMGVVIGARSNFPYNVGVYQARSLNESDETETETEVEKPKRVRKPKTEKPESKPKRAKKSDAAPPVEAEVLPSSTEVVGSETVACDSVNETETGAVEEILNQIES